MTVSSNTSTASFQPNNATVFPLPFRFFDNDDLRVYRIDTSSGLADLQVLGVDYTLSGAGEPELDGTPQSVLTLTDPLALGGPSLYVERVMEVEQPTDIVNQGRFFAEVHEDAFDRLTMLIQQADANSNGAIRVAIGDPEPNRLPPAPQRANKLLSFDSKGDPIAVAPSSGDASELAIDLANSTDPAKGAGLVGYLGLTVAHALGLGYVSLEQYGGQASPGFDNTAALIAAATAANGRPILVPDGATYPILTPGTISAPLVLVGGGTLLFETTGQTALTCTGVVSVSGVTLDGNNVANEFLRCSGPRLYMHKCVVRNAFQPAAADGVLPIRTIDTAYVHIDGVTFSSIAAPANGVVGDPEGAVTAIQIGGACEFGLIENCIFDDIHNRATAGGTLQYEDADAIRQFSTVGIQNVTIRDNKFTNIGKRCHKAIVPVGSVTRYLRNKSSSPYVGTPDTAIAVGNGMHSITSCYGGDFEVSDNSHAGGVVMFFAESSGPDVRKVKVKNNDYAPEFHKYANTSMTRFVFVGAGFLGPLSAQASLQVSGNNVSGVQIAVTSLAQITNVTDNPRLESAGPGVHLEQGGSIMVTGNNFSQVSGTVPSTEGAYGVFHADGVVASTISGNIFNGKFDGVYVAAQVAAFRVVVGANAFVNLARADVFVSDEADRQFVTQLANGTPATTPINSMRIAGASSAVAGGASALPATPVGYMRIYLNGTEQKIPYYGV